MSEISGGTQYIDRYRYYAPNLGSWLSRDPIGRIFMDEPGHSFYQYVRSSPVSRTDPTGLFDKHSFCKRYPDYGPCETEDCNGCIYDECIRALDAIFDIAKRTKVFRYFLTDRCEAWCNEFNRLATGKILINDCTKSGNSEIYDITAGTLLDLGVGFFGSDAHVIYEIVFCDGAILYVDNEYWGGDDHVFTAAEIPGYAKKGPPPKRNATNHPWTFP